MNGISSFLKRALSESVDRRLTTRNFGVLEYNSMNFVMDKVLSQDFWGFRSSESEVLNFKDARPARVSGLPFVQNNQIRVAVDNVHTCPHRRHYISLHKIGTHILWQLSAISIECCYWILPLNVTIECYHWMLLVTFSSQTMVHTTC